MPWGKRIFYRSKSSTPSGPALDLLAPKQAFDESGSPTTTTTEDGTPVSDDEEEDETDNEGLSQSATKRLGQRFCVLAGLVATLLLVLGCIRIAVAYNRVAASSAASASPAWWESFSQEGSASMDFHSPGNVGWAKGYLAWSRTDPAGSAADAAPAFKFRLSRFRENPLVRPGYMQLLDELLEYDAEGKVVWSSFVEGVRCSGDNWDMMLYPYLQLKEVSSADGACARVLAAEEPEMGNMSFCLSQDGLPQSLNISLLASFSGGSNAGFFTISSTFVNVTSGPLPPDAFARPKPCTEGPPPVHCPYNISWPTEVVTHVHFTHAAGKDCGLNNVMTNDLLGSLTYGATDYEFLQVYNVTVNKGFAPIQDCNYNPQLGQRVCDGGSRNSSNAKSVGRSSARYLEGEFLGQCTENEAAGSWFSFPSVGECAAGWDVGFNGCTWKTEAFRVVKFQCVMDRCKSILLGHDPGHVHSFACFQEALWECPDFRGPMGPTCFSKPDPDILV